MKNLRNTPKIYVGTYGMYNSGSLFGKWFDLSDYNDAEEFYKDCYEYHRNEFLPELMFQDWEHIPSFLTSECSLHEGVPQMLERYFDYEAFGKDFFLEGYSEYKDHVFMDI